MGAMAKGALIGLVVGVTQAALWAVSTPWDGHSGVRGPYSFPMLVAPFLIGSVAAAPVRLRRRLLVVLAGGIITVALAQALWRLTPAPAHYGFDRALLGMVHLAAAVTGFAVVAWAVATIGRWWVKAGVLGVLVIGCVLAVPAEEPVRRWHLARGFELAGIPLVAPDVAGHRLSSVEAPIVGGVGAPVISLYYQRFGAESAGSIEGVQVVLWRAAPTGGCPRPYYAEFWENGGGPCRAIGPDRWVRHHEKGFVLVQVRRGDALVELDSGALTEEGLLAAADTIRPVAAETLAEQVRPVR